MIFNEQEHTYRNEKGDQYLGATSFIKRFTKPFEREKRAKAYAKKNKRIVEEVLAEWDKAGKDAIDKGLFYHKIKENELINKDSILVDGDDHIIYKPVWNNGEKVHTSQKLEYGVYPELIVWSDKYMIAGQADLVEITKKGYINIKDYKTSKEIKTESFKNWNGSYQMMKFPLNGFQDCNFSHYSLQINLYAFLIKQHNRQLKIGKLQIEHVVADFINGELNIKRVETYKVPNLQEEIKIVLDYYKIQDE